MNSLFKQGALWLLLMLGMASAFAWPGANQPLLQAIQFQPYAQQQNQGRERGARNDDRRGRDGAEAPRRQPQDNAGPPNAGRQGRMTPDERRALRRQIDEAGQDLYRKR